MSVKKIGDFKFDKNSKKFKVFKKRVPIMITTEAVEHYKTGFRTGGGQTDKGKWKPRQIFDPEVGKKAIGRAILVQSGHLRDSISTIRARWKSMIIGTRGVRYAAIHNDGGTIKQIVTPKQRAFLLYKGNKLKKAGSPAADMFTAAGLSEELNIDIPQREFIGDSRKLNNKLVKLIKKQMRKVLE